MLMPRVFYPAETYSDAHSEYHLLPFRFLRLNGDNELLVNEVGEFVIAGREQRAGPRAKTTHPRH